MQESKLARRWTWVALALALAAGWIAGQAGAGKLGLRDEMGAEEFRRCGLHKLDSEELAALEAWFDLRRCGNLMVGSGKPASPANGSGGERPPGNYPEKRRGDDDGIVSFNQSTLRYHCPSCESAKRCTRNCIRISRAAAIARGGEPCQNCGGRCP